jgi:hypothetical protein
VLRQSLERDEAGFATDAAEMLAGIATPSAGASTRVIKQPESVTIPVSFPSYTTAAAWLLAPGWSSHNGTRLPPADSVAPEEPGESQATWLGNAVDALAAPPSRLPESFAATRRLIARAENAARAACAREMLWRRAADSICDITKRLVDTAGAELREAGTRVLVRERSMKQQLHADVRSEFTRQLLFEKCEHDRRLKAARLLSREEGAEAAKQAAARRARGVPDRADGGDADSLVAGENAGGASAEVFFSLDEVMDIKRKIRNESQAIDDSLSAARAELSQSNAEKEWLRAALRGLLQGIGLAAAPAAAKPASEEAVLAGSGAEPLLDGSLPAAWEAAEVMDAAGSTQPLRAITSEATAAAESGRQLDKSAGSGAVALALVFRHRGAVTRACRAPSEPIQALAKALVAAARATEAVLVGRQSEKQVLAAQTSAKSAQDSALAAKQALSEEKALRAAVEASVAELSRKLEASASALGAAEEARAAAEAIATSAESRAAKARHAESRAESAIADAKKTRSALAEQEAAMNGLRAEQEEQRVVVSGLEAELAAAQSRAKAAGSDTASLTAALQAATDEAAGIRKQLVDAQGEVGAESAALRSRIEELEAQQARQLQTIEEHERLQSHMQEQVREHTSRATAGLPLASVFPEPVPASPGQQDVGRAATKAKALKLPALARPPSSEHSSRGASVGDNGGLGASVGDDGGRTGGIAHSGSPSHHRGSPRQPRPGGSSRPPLPPQRPTSSHPTAKEVDPVTLHGARMAGTESHHARRVGSADAALDSLVSPHPSQGSRFSDGVLEPVQLMPMSGPVGRHGEGSVTAEAEPADDRRGFAAPASLNNDGTTDSQASTDDRQDPATDMMPNPAGARAIAAASAAAAGVEAVRLHQQQLETRERMTRRRAVEDARQADLTARLALQAPRGDAAGGVDGDVMASLDSLAASLSDARPSDAELDRIMAGAKKRRHPNHKPNPEAAVTPTTRRRHTKIVRMTQGAGDASESGGRWPRAQSPLGAERLRAAPRGSSSRGRLDSPESLSVSHIVEPTSPDGMRPDQRSGSAAAAAGQSQKPARLLPIGHRHTAGSEHTPSKAPAAVAAPAAGRATSPPTPRFRAEAEAEATGGGAIIGSPSLVLSPGAETSGALSDEGLSPEWGREADDARAAAAAGVAEGTDGYELDRPVWERMDSAHRPRMLFDVHTSSIDDLAERLSAGESLLHGSLSRPRLGLPVTPVRAATAAGLTPAELAAERRRKGARLTAPAGRLPGIKGTAAQVPQEHGRRAGTGTASARLSARSRYSASGASLPSTALPVQQSAWSDAQAQESKQDAPQRRQTASWQRSSHAEHPSRPATTQRLGVLAYGSVPLGSVSTGDL